VFSSKTNVTLIKNQPSSNSKEKELTTIDLDSLNSVIEPVTKVDSLPEKTASIEDVQSDGAESDVWPLEKNPWPIIRGDINANTCEICNCNYFFASYRALMDHKSKVHRIGSSVMHYCDQCLYQNASMTHLKLHLIRWHTVGEMKYECNRCGRKFKHEL
jgi:hypothetical protein